MGNASLSWFFLLLKTQMLQQFALEHPGGFTDEELAKAKTEKNRLDICEKRIRDGFLTFALIGMVNKVHL